MDHSEHEIIIIGAGTAGLYAAKILSEAGKRILILEAEDKAGGRITNVDDFSFGVEGGAEFIHGHQEETFLLMKEAGLIARKVRGNFYNVRNGKWTSSFGSDMNWYELMEKMKECKTDMTVEEFIARWFGAPRYEMLRNQFRGYVRGYDAADTNYASILSVKNEMSEGDDVQYRIDSGYSGIINYLVKSCSAGHTIIRYSEVVQKIKLGKLVSVQTNKKEYLAHNVVIAVPLGVLQCEEKSPGYIDFPKELKAHIRIAKKLGNGAVIKLMFEFDGPFWLDSSFLCLRKIKVPSYIFSNTVIPTWWTQSPSKLPLLTGWLAGPDALKMKNQNDKMIRNLGLESLASIFAMSLNELDKRLRLHKIINWAAKPYILGGYSYATVGGAAIKSILQKPFQNQVFFAGEYLPANAFSTVEAALLSGKNVANQLL
jgi:monoamine oxidase